MPASGDAGPRVARGRHGAVRARCGRPVSRGKPVGVEVEVHVSPARLRRRERRSRVLRHEVEVVDRHLDRHRVAADRGAGRGADDSNRRRGVSRLALPRFLRGAGGPLRSPRSIARVVVAVVTASPGGDHHECAGRDPQRGHSTDQSGECDCRPGARTSAAQLTPADSRGSAGHATVIQVSDRQDVARRQSSFSRMGQVKRADRRRRFRETTPGERLESALRLSELATELRSGLRTRGG